jgi:hypothetical protein
MWKSVLITTWVTAGGVAVIATSLAADSVPDLASVQAEDPQRSVQYLYESCTSADSFKQIYCAGYISATMDTMTVLGTYGPAQALATEQAYKHSKTGHRSTQTLGA